ncbi:LuxR C-terminal-related transcriptional regulator [Nocardiopsis dassonvillei]|uniref:helix-turn-helix transcriptional regulator n=1 Tax=Nocardiopsis dassonvillei TaxID=2014 RepID=UPI0036FFFA9E
MDDRTSVLLLGGFHAHSRSLAEELDRVGVVTSVADRLPDDRRGFGAVLVSADHPHCVRAVRELGGEGEPAVLVIGVPGYHETILSCLETGIAGLVSAEEPFESLVRAVREAAQRGTVGGRGLTRRQTQVLALVAAGLPNREIAGRLGVRTHTVKNHVQSILGKLGVSSRTAAAVALTGGASMCGGGGLGVR